MEKIANIIDANFRSGVAKTGKPYTMMKITTDSGKEASVFAPAQVGDPVEVTYNEQYKNYSARVINATKMEQVIKQEEQDNKLDEVIEKLDLILATLNIDRPSGLEKARATAEALRPEVKEETKDEVVMGDITDDGEINLDDIPF